MTMQEVEQGEEELSEKEEGNDPVDAGFEAYYRHAVAQEAEAAGETGDNEDAQSDAGSDISEAPSEVSEVSVASETGGAFDPWRGNDENCE